MSRQEPPLWLTHLRENLGLLLFETDVHGQVQAIMQSTCSTRQSCEHQTTWAPAPTRSQALLAQLDRAAERLQDAQRRHQDGEEVPPWT